MQSIITSIATKLLAFALAAIIVFVPQGVAGVTSQSLAVPLYGRPDNTTSWNDVAAAGSGTVPFVVANPQNGPGAAQDPVYVNALNQNTNSGIRTLGYIQTNYQARPFKEAYNDIDTWYRFYPNTKGIFIDLVKEGSTAEVCYAAALYSHVKNVRPNDVVVLSSGSHISKAYEPYGDIFLNASSDYDTYQNWKTLHRGFEDKPNYQNRFWHVVYGVTSANYSSAFDMVRANNAGWTYITDKTVPTPFSTLPSYWQNETSDVSALPASSIPNRGKTALPRGCISLSASADNTVDTTTAKQSVTKSAVTVNNTSSTYDSEPVTRLQVLSVPGGASLSALSGEGWTCNVGPRSSLCNQDTTLPAGSSTKLATVVQAGCQFGGGDAVLRLVNYAGNQWDVKVPVRAPIGCDPSTPAGRSNTDTRGQVISTTTQSVETTPEITPLGGHESAAPKKDEASKKGLSPLKIALIIFLVLLLLGVAALAGVFIHQRRRYKVRI